MYILGAFLWPLLAIPIATGKFAQSQGRPFWVWLGLGFVLPVISMIVLFFLHDEKKQTS